jgi:hypothetical protein
MFLMPIVLIGISRRLFWILVLFGLSQFQSRILCFEYLPLVDSLIILKWNTILQWSIVNHAWTRKWSYNGQQLTIDTHVAAAIELLMSCDANWKTAFIVFCVSWLTVMQMDSFLLNTVLSLPLFVYGQCLEKDLVDSPRWFSIEQFS